MDKYKRLWRGRNEQKRIKKEPYGKNYDPVGSMTIERGTSVSVACSNEISFVAGYEVGPVIAEF